MKVRSACPRRLIEGGGASSREGAVEGREEVKAGWVKIYSNKITQINSFFAGGSGRVKNATSSTGPVCIRPNDEKGNPGLIPLGLAPTKARKSIQVVASPPQSVLARKKDVLASNPLRDRTLRE